MVDGGAVAGEAFEIFSAVLFQTSGWGFWFQWSIESAGVILASSDPRSVGGVIRLSRASYRKVIENRAWAAGYNTVAIPLATGVLAWPGITLLPAVGAVLMSLSTIVVALNAQLLRRVQLTPQES